MAELHEYPFEIRPLTKDEGDGYLISFPDFSECISDGETVQETITNGMDALKETIAALQEFGHPVPQPGQNSSSGKFITRVPKSVHAKLVTLAQMEGVSMNALVSSVLAQHVGAVGR